MVRLQRQREHGYERQDRASAVRDNFCVQSCHLAWRATGWRIRDTTHHRGRQGTGTMLICPKHHESWGKSLREAESEVKAGIHDCPACKRARGFFVYSQ